MSIRKRNQSQEHAGLRARQRALAELSRRALGVDNPQALMDDAVADAARYLGSDYAAVFELLPAGTKMRLCAGVGWKARSLEHITVDADDHSLAGYTLRSGVPLVANDLRTESRFKVPPLLAEHRVTRGITVNIQGRGRPFGVLGTFSARRRSYSADEADFLQTVANMLAIVIARKDAEETEGRGREPVRTSGTLQDISEHMPTEATVADAKRRMDAALLAGEVGTWDWNVKTDRVWGDSNFARFYAVEVDARGTAPHSDYIAAVHPDDRERVRALVTRTLETGCNYEAEYRVNGKDGRERSVIIRAKAERNATGRVVSFPGIVLDVTQRKKAEEALRRSEGRLRLAAEMVGLCHYEWNFTKGLPVWDARLKQMWGLPPDAHIDREVILSAIHPDDRPVVDSAIARALDPNGDGQYAAEYRVIGIQDSVERWVTARGCTFFDDGKPVEYLGTAMEITERKRLEKEILEIGERERRRIGQDLHDDLCQQLTGIAFSARLLQQRLARRIPSSAAAAEEIVQAVQKAAARAHELAKGLHPVRLEAEGIAATLREFAANIQMVFRIPCRFRCRGMRDDAPFTKPDVAIQLYRIVQEAVTNSVKHGKAKNIFIHLSIAKGRSKLSVVDDGVGIADERPDSGMGLRIMNERARVIGAALTIARRRRGGTLVTCSLGGKAVGALWRE